MTTQEFIDIVAKYVIKYANDYYEKDYDIMVHSPIIAQGILESARGTSELARNANNIFGLKYKEGRCPTASGIYYKVGSEQNEDGSYTESAMQWCKFDSIEGCVRGYFDFIKHPRYLNLEGVTDPFVYLTNIRADGYATSLKYVENLMNVINDYNLTQYDDEVKDMPKLKIAIDAGHGLYTAGKRCMKSIDPNETREWKLNSRIAEELQKLLESYDCEVLRVDDITGKTDIPLSTRVAKANSWKADIYIAFHHNAGVGGTTSGGTVMYYYSSNSERLAQAKDFYNKVIEQTRLVGNRSSKVIRKGFYVIKYTNMPAFLIENGFMDSTTDVPIILTDTHAQKTALGTLNFLKSSFGLVAKETTSNEANTSSEDTVKDDEVVVSGNPYVKPTKTLVKNYVRGIAPSDEVKWLQYELGITVDGYFGSGTESALINYKEKMGFDEPQECGEYTVQFLLDN